MTNKINQKVKRRPPNTLDWPPEVDALILDISDGETTIPEIRKRVLEVTGDDRSVSSIRHRMQYLGAPMRQRGNPVRINADMKDFVYAKLQNGESISGIRDEFNEYFDTDYNYTRIWRIALDAHADRDRGFSKDVFALDWTRLQQKLSPDGAICTRHWLWRWHRFDEKRTAMGCVFHGTKEEIPQLLTKGQFRDQWTAMQKLFGIASS
jgi:hypothetical protein